MMMRLKMAMSLVLCAVASVHGAQAPPAAAAGLGGTVWRLVRFQGSDGTTLTPDGRDKYTIAFNADGRVAARIDCNRGSGTWTSSGAGQLQIGPLALTRAMCPSSPLNDRIARDFGFVRSYVLKGEHLFLSLMADGGIYEFEPIAGSKPAAAASPVKATGPIAYVCTRAGGGADALSATFYQTQPAMVLVERGGRTRPAFQVVAASGAKYEGDELMFWDARGGASVIWSGVELSCAKG
jgi:heat shock protein HslJ